MRVDEQGYRGTRTRGSTRGSRTVACHIACVSLLSALWLMPLAARAADAAPLAPTPTVQRNSDSRLRHYRKWILAAAGFALAQTVALAALLLTIRRLKHTQNVLRRKEAFNFALFQYNPIETIVVDREGRVVRSNLARRRSGARQPAIGALMYKDYAAHHSIDMRAELMACIQSGPARAFPNQRYGDRVLAITLSPFSEGAIIISQDVTEQTRAEDRMAALNRTFLDFGTDPDENIGRLVSLFSHLLGAAFTLYNRLDGGMLSAVSSIQAPADLPDKDKPEGHICYDLIRDEHRDFMVVRDVPNTAYYQTDPHVRAYGLKTYVGHVVKLGRRRIGAVCAGFKKDFGPAQNDRWLMGVVASAIAVEEARKLDQEALRRNEERFRTIADYTYDTETWFGKDRRLLWINPAVERMTGFSPQECLEMPAFPLGLVHPQDLGRVRDAYIAAFRDLTSESNLEYRIRHKDGHLVWIGASWQPIHDDQGDCMGLRGSLRDITQRVQAEQSQRSMAAQVQRAQKLESLGVLAGGIAHDFNNLLMGILGNAEIALLDAKENPPIRKNLEAIERSSKQAADLCRQLLAYSGKGKFLIEPLDLTEVVRGTQDLIHVLVSKKAVVRYVLDNNLPAVEGDVSQIRQVLINLLTNASEAIGEREGSIIVKVSLETLQPSNIAALYLGEGLVPGPYVCLNVMDTGDGMDPQTKARIFEPFFTTKFAGRGLGLAAVLGIMRSHKGDLRVDSQPGKGTSISLYFPPTSAVAPLTPTLTPSQKTWRGQGMVLLADDEAVVREVAGEMLKRMGFSVITAVDGHDAVSQFEKHAEEIVLVLLDMTMPRLSGHEAFQKIRRIREHTPVLLCSGYGEQSAARDLAGQNPAGFIHKPFTMTALQEKIAAVLDGHTPDAVKGRKAHPQNAPRDIGTPLPSSEESSC